MLKTRPKVTIFMLTIEHNVPQCTCGGIDMDYTWGQSGARKKPLTTASKVVLYPTSRVSRRNLHCSSTRVLSTAVYVK